MGRHVIIEKFWAEWYDGDKTLATEDLGWADNVRRDAQSDSPELIFQYVVETIGFNILFYWVKDRNFYTIETERTPIEVRRIDGNPAWDGETEFLKAGGEGGPSTCSRGQVIATFADATQMWDNLKIGSTPIGEVLQDSLIISMD